MNAAEDPVGYRTVRHPLVGQRVRDVASGQQGQLREVADEQIEVCPGHKTRVRLAYIRPEGGGYEWSTAVANVSPAES
jgi:hypothetical protein